MTKPIDRNLSPLPSNKIDLSAAPPSEANIVVGSADTIDSPSAAMAWDDKLRHFIIGLKERCLKIIRVLWDTILYEVLFFIFNREREVILELEAEMEVFIDLYHELNRDKPESIALLKEKFTELSADLQQRVKDELAILLKRSNSDKAVEEVLEDDLEHEANVDGKAHKTFLFIAACLKTAHNPKPLRKND